MNRTFMTWILFGICLAVGLAAMGGISLAVLRLDQAERDARRQAVLEENVRLALWRMDSSLSTLIAQENARPYFAYGAFYPAERAYNRMYAQLEHGEVLVPSPLLTWESPHVLLHFQIGPDGELTSPQVPSGNMRDLAESGYTSPERIEAAARRLSELREKADRPRLLAAAGSIEEQRLEPGPEALTVTAQTQATAPPEQQQSLRSSVEWTKRLANVAQNTIQERGQANVAVLTSHVNEGVLRPVWVGDVLLLVRRVSVGKSIYVQGAWLNWPAIHAGLLASSQDLLPEADLRPIDEEGAAHAERRLAALPARLVPGSLPPEPRPAVSMARLTLAVAWCGILLAALAVGALLLGTVSLSERRGAFVSAVTHELRTPLTTFRLYTEMLAEGMVQSEEKQRAYLQTLKAEAERLNHLVENVLAYARLERGRGPARPETVTARDLVDRMEDRLAAHARQHGMDLAVEVEERIAHAQVRTDVSTVEQILLNLVDNACKYAAAAADRRIHLAVKGVEGHVEVSVRDHGPGIARTDRRRLFRPFSKSAREAANSAPGIGLGLALSRRLARTLGGDLRLDETVRDGASLDLLLPLS